MVVRASFAAAHAAEDEEVEEVHRTKHYQHHSNLDGESLNALLCVVDCVAKLESQGNVTEIDEVEADYQQVIDGVGQRLVAVEDIHQKDAAILVERARYPDGQGDANRQVNQVSGYSYGHDQPPLS